VLLISEKSNDGEKIKELVKTQFGREAEKYITSQVHSDQSDLEFVKNFIEPKSSWRVLDIGTGTGHLALSLAPHVNEVIASDITDEMLDQAELMIKERKVSNVQAKTLDVHEIPFPDASFDLVTSRIAPHHFHDIQTATKEMARIVKPGGHIFIQDTISPEDKDAAEFFNQIERLRDPSHVQTQSITGWKDLLEKNESTVLKIEKKTKEWNLKWWLDRMSTPEENRKEILKLLNDSWEKHRSHLEIVKEERKADEEKQWTILPHNGYFLAQKI
jgi:ubiquinone/menaquinone biosynthesis C-methylase UbiE